MYASLKVTQPGFSIAPMLNSGTKSWLYSSKGYVSPKYFSKKSRPAAVIRKTSSPCARRGHAHGHGRLQVRLIEAGEHLVRVEGLEVGVHVDLAVDRVAEPV